MTMHLSCLCLYLVLCDNNVHLFRSWVQQSRLHSRRTMENFHRFNIDRLLWMLDAALTRQNEKQKAAILKITENKVH